MNLMQITKKNIHRVPQGQNSQCSKCLLRQNNILLKCQAVPLRRQLKEEGKNKENVVLSFNVTWAWDSFTRLTGCQEISIKGTCDFLSHPYISIRECPRGFSRIHPHCSSGKLSSPAPYIGYFKQCKRHWIPINFHKGIKG